MPRHMLKLLCLIIALSAALVATAETAANSRNLILIQAQYCPQIADLPLLGIDYEKGMRKQVYQDRSLIPAEYFLKCPRKDARQWPCIDHRDAWDEQRWDPRPELNNDKLQLGD